MLLLSLYNILGALYESELRTFCGLKMLIQVFVLYKRLHASIFSTYVLPLCILFQLKIVLIARLFV